MTVTVASNNPLPPVLPPVAAATAPMAPLATVAAPNPVAPVQPQKTPQVPANPPKGRYEQMLNAEQVQRRNQFLSQTKYTLSPKNPDPKIPSPPIQFAVPELLSFLKYHFDKRDIVRENPWLVGGGASHVMTGMEYADVDICYYIKKDELSFIYNTIKKFIRSKIGKIPNLTEEQISKYIDKTYLYNKIRKDGFSFVGLGGVDLKFILSGDHRLSVGASDGFHIPLDLYKSKARCVDGFAWCDKEEFEKALSDLQCRKLILKDAAKLHDITWRLAHRLTLGYSIESAENKSTEELADIALEQIKTTYPLNDAEKRKLFKDKFFKHQSNHYNLDPLARRIDFLNILSFFHTRAEQKQASAAHRDALHAYTTLLAEAWTDLNIKSLNAQITPLLEPLCCLIKKEPGHTKDLLALAKGLFLLDSLKSPDTFSAYTFPFSENQHKPRFHIGMKQPQGIQYLSVDGSPIDVAKHMLTAWFKLEKLYAADPITYNIFLKFGEGLGLANIPVLSKDCRIQNTQTLYNAFLQHPIATILSNQFKGTSHETPALFYEFLKKEMGDFLGAATASHILQTQLFVCHQSLGQVDPLVNQLILEMSVLAQACDAPPVPNDLQKLSSMMSLLKKIATENKAGKIQSSPLLTKCLKDLLDGLLKKFTNPKYARVDLILMTGELFHEAAVAGIYPQEDAYGNTKRVIENVVVLLDIASPQYQGNVILMSDYLKKIYPWGKKSNALKAQIDKQFNTLTFEAFCAAQKAAKNKTSMSDLFDAAQYLHLILANLALNQNPKADFDSRLQKRVVTFFCEFIQNALIIKNDELLHFAGVLTTKLLRRQLTIEPDQILMMIRLCQALFIIASKDFSPKFSDGAKNLLLYLDCYQHDEAIQDKLLTLVFTFIISSFIAKGITEDRKRVIFQSFVESLLNNNLIKNKFPEERKKIQALQNATPPLSLSQIFLELIQIAHVLKLSTLAYLTQPAFLINVLNKEDLAKLASFLNNLAFSQDFVKNTQAYLQSQSNIPIHFDANTLQRELESVIKEDADIKSLIFMLQTLLYDKNSSSELLAFQQIFAIIKKIFHDGKGDEIISKSALLSLFSHIFGTIIQKVCTNPEASPALLIEVQEFTQMAFQHGLFNENVACKSAEFILAASQARLSANSPEFLIQVKAFIVTIGGWEAISKELQSKIESVEAQISKIALPAAKNLLDAEVAPKTVDLLAKLLHLALQSPPISRDIILAQTCCQFAKTALSLKHGFNLRLAFEILITALNHKLSFAPEHYATIQEVSQQLLELRPDKLEEGIEATFYYHLGLDLSVALALNSNDNALLRETRGTLLKNIGQILISNIPPAKKWHHFKSCATILEKLRSPEEVWSFWDELLNTTTIEDFSNNLSNILKVFIRSAFTIERSAAVRFITNKKLKECMKAEDFAFVKYLQNNYRILFIAKDLNHLAEQTLGIPQILKGDLQLLQSASLGQIQSNDSSICQLLRSFETYLFEHTNPPSYVHLKHFYDQLAKIPNSHFATLVGEELFNLFDQILFNVLKQALQQPNICPDEIILCIEHFSLALNQKRISNETAAKIFDAITAASVNESTASSPELLVGMTTFLAILNPSFVNSASLKKMEIRLGEMAIHFLPKKLNNLEEGDNFDITQKCLIGVLESPRNPKLDHFIADACAQIVRHAIKQKKCEALRLAYELISKAFSQGILFDSAQGDLFFALVQELLNPSEHIEKGKSWSTYLQLGLNFLVAIETKFPGKPTHDKIIKLLVTNISDCLLSPFGHERKKSTIEKYLTACCFYSFTKNLPWVLPLGYIDLHDFKKDFFPVLNSWLLCLFENDAEEATRIATHPKLKSRLDDNGFMLIQLLLIRKNASNPSKVYPLDEFKLWQALKPLDIKWDNQELPQRIIETLIYLQCLLSAQTPPFNKIEFLVNAIIRTFEAAKKQNLEDNAWSIARTKISFELDPVIKLLRSQQTPTKLAELLYTTSVEIGIVLDNDQMVHLNQYVSGNLSTSATDISVALEIVKTVQAMISNCLVSNNPINFRAALNAFRQLLQVYPTFWRLEAMDRLPTDFLRSLPKLKLKEAEKEQLGLELLAILAENLKKGGLAATCPSETALVPFYQAFVDSGLFLHNFAIWNEFVSIWESYFAIHNNTNLFVSVYVSIMEKAAVSNDKRYFDWYMKALVENKRLYLQCFFQIPVPLQIYFFQHVTNLCNTLSASDTFPYLDLLKIQLSEFCSLLPQGLYLAEASRLLSMTIELGLKKNTAPLLLWSLKLIDSHQKYANGTMCFTVLEKGGHLLSIPAVPQPHQVLSLIDSFRALIETLLIQIKNVDDRDKQLLSLIKRLQAANDKHSHTLAFVLLHMFFRIKAETTVPKIDPTTKARVEPTEKFNPELTALIIPLHKHALQTVFLCSPINFENYYMTSRLVLGQCLGGVAYGKLTIEIAKSLLTEMNKRLKRQDFSKLDVQTLFLQLKILYHDSLYLASKKFMVENIQEVFTIAINKKNEDWTKEMQEHLELAEKHKLLDSSSEILCRDMYIQALCKSSVYLPNMLEIVKKQMKLIDAGNVIFLHNFLRLVLSVHDRVLLSVAQDPTSKEYEKFLKLFEEILNLPKNEETSRIILKYAACILKRMITFYPGIEHTVNAVNGYRDKEKITQTLSTVGACNSFAERSFATLEKPLEQLLHDLIGLKEPVIQDIFHSISLLKTDENIPKMLHAGGRNLIGKFAVDLITIVLQSSAFQYELKALKALQPNALPSSWDEIKAKYLTLAILIEFQRTMVRFYPDISGVWIKSVKAAVKGNAPLLSDAWRHFVTSMREKNAAASAPPATNEKSTPAPSSSKKKKKKKKSGASNVH